MGEMTRVGTNATLPRLVSRVRFPIMRTILTLCVLAATTLAMPEQTYLGLYMRGAKIGYASYDSAATMVAGKPATKSDSRTEMNLGLLGTPMKIEVVSSTWVSKQGRPLKMTFAMSSGGRAQHVLAMFGQKQVQVDVDNGGAKSHRVLDIPKGGSITDDPLTVVLSDKMAVGKTRSFYVLDPTTLSFLKNDVKVVGPSETEVHGKRIRANLVEIADPRATVKVYLSAKGDLVEAIGPLDIEMLPESRTVAMGPNAKYAPSVDLAYSTSVRTDKPIEDPRYLTELKLKLTGKDLSNLPSDEHQTVSRESGGWLIDVHPPKFSEIGDASIAEVAHSQPAWTKPSLYVPSDSVRFKKLAATLVGGKKDERGAVLAIKNYVYQTMHPNAGIGVLRDAGEVLTTKEGVCRDYAILTCTILRAAGIPTRLCSGLVNWDGTFYYHAWDEVWDGSKWLGVDSTTPDVQLSAGHVKLNDGNVDTAFTFALLDNVKVEVLGAQR